MLRPWFFLWLLGCAPAVAQPAPVIDVQKSAPEPRERTVPREARAEPTELMPLAHEIVEHLSLHDMDGVAQRVHPERGVRFSPYAFVEEGDVVLKRAELSGAWRDSQLRVWGAFDGSGEPIRLPFRDYFARFVYDADFAHAPEVAENRIIGSGNTTNNLAQSYPHAEFVEFHFPPTDGMNWRSLRLVFARDAGRLWLVGIIHDEWTI